MPSQLVESRSFRFSGQLDRRVIWMGAMALAAGLRAADIESTFLDAGVDRRSALARICHVRFESVGPALIGLPQIDGLNAHPLRPTYLRQPRKPADC